MIHIKCLIKCQFEGDFLKKHVFLIEREIRKLKREELKRQMFIEKINGFISENFNYQAQNY